MTTKTEQLNRLFDQWIENCSFKVFMRDGIICEQRYENVLFILKDVNNAKPDELNDMRIDVQTSLSGGKTWFNIARWASALLDGKEFPRFQEDVFAIYKNDYHTFQHDQLQRVSIVNLKKEAGGGNVSNTIVNKYAITHKNYLIKEIEICSPKIIVVCGVGIFDGVQAVLGTATPIKKPRPQFELATDWVIGTVSLDTRKVPIVQFRHPSTGCSAEKSYNDMIKIREYLREYI